MKYDTVLPGKAVTYYRNFVGISRWERQPVLKTRDFEIRKNNNSNHWQAVWGAKPRPLNNLCVGNNRYESQITKYWITKKNAAWRIIKSQYVWN